MEQTWFKFPLWVFSWQFWPFSIDRNCGQKGAKDNQASIPNNYLLFFHDYHIFEINLWLFFQTVSISSFIRFISSWRLFSLIRVNLRIFYKLWAFKSVLSLSYLLNNAKSGKKDQSFAIPSIFEINNYSIFEINLWLNLETVSIYIISANSFL